MSAFSQNPRPWIIRGVFVVLAVILIARLFTLQILDDKYKVMAEGQAIFRKVVYPARGAIIDRKGKALLINNVAYDLACIPNKIKDLDTAQFCTVMGIDQATFLKTMKKLITRNGYQRQSIYEAGLSQEKNARLQENLYLFEGFELLERSTRTYPLGIGAHIFGYLNEVSEGMLGNSRYASYRQGDYVGQSGLESRYEEVLRGQRGVAYMVRDVLNRPRDSYKNGSMDTPSIAGRSLELYLDADLQAYGEKLMAGKIGSAIAIDPKTGGILALVSAPSYDPNLLSGATFAKGYTELSRSYTRPLFNRAILAQYPPGSTFKPLTALIGLDVGVITPAFGYPCGGGYYACGRRIGCTHSGGGHAANLRLAMANSCNSYFCDVFRKTVDAKKWAGGTHEGLQRWHDYLSAFGLGHPLGIDIPGEKPGGIPDSSYFNQKYHGSWNSCTMVFVGMGQGEVDMTPLQMANAMCLIANRGYYYIPHFVKSVGGNAQDPTLKDYLVKHTPTHISDSAFESVIMGMEDVVNRGTGRVAILPGVEVCGKTGTVENYWILNGQKTKLDNHSVFVCFAPKNDPKIAIAVVVQNSGYGATWAGPIASLMMEKYLKDSISGASRIALQEKMYKANTVKSYIRVIDSLQRQKDLLRDMLRTADRRTQDSVKKQRDTMLVRQIMKEYYQLNTGSEVKTNNGTIRFQN
ncbi:penicillin-binding protein 2 [Taibaiella koreensis]|uniref:penicillin-binding protein 2 n=1 Tax=Taibaiella koreensis TaxID=1268548 RepID=UPI0013C2CDB4|nr:penicillin-binding protein 2 [Taibaiella koreensis]